MIADGEDVPAARYSRAACLLRLASLPLTGFIPAVALATALICASPGVAFAQSAFPVASQPSGPAAPPTGLAAPKTVPKVVIANPAWKDLSPTQQQALSPLATEWDKLDTTHKSKWLALIKKFVVMKPDEQMRVQERMRAWAALTPDQRRVARESYTRAKKLNTDQKSAQWEQYQQLPDEQKKKLAAEAAKNKVATPPPALSKPKVVPTLKSAPKPVLQESVRPHANGSETLGKPASAAPDTSAANPRVSAAGTAAPSEK